jgi:hypothetical protein
MLLKLSGCSGGCTPGAEMSGRGSSGLTSSLLFNFMWHTCAHPHGPFLFTVRELGLDSRRRSRLGGSPAAPAVYSGS